MQAQLIQNSRDLRTALDIAVIKIYCAVDGEILKNALIPLTAAEIILFELEENAGHA